MRLTTTAAVLLLTALLLAFVPRVHAQAPAGTVPAPVSQAAPVPAASTAAQPEAAAPSYRDYFKALGYSFTHGLFAQDQLLPFAIGSAATLAFLPADREISDAVRGHADTLGKAGNIIGSPFVISALGGGLVLGSLASDNARFRSYAFALSQSLIVSASITTVAKLATMRTRPDGEDKRSFPSGHAAATFALAAVSSHYYGKKAGIPLYALASLVALSRVTSGKHFPSDVVAGATIGYLAGRAAVAGTQHVSVGASGRSIALSFTF